MTTTTHPVGDLTRQRRRGLRDEMAAAGIDDATEIALEDVNRRLVELDRRGWRDLRGDPRRDLVQAVDRDLRPQDRP